MRRLITTAFLMVGINATAQSNTASNLIEGGKTLVELVRVFKTPKNAAPRQSLIESKDSCVQKNLADICYKNISGNSITISFFKRTGQVYAPALTLKIASNGQECLYELQAGIYKYKVESGDQKLLQSEGEIKLNACDKIVKEIK
ncbi:hypothetical protein [Ferruginibacter profundus]